MAEAKTKMSNLGDSLKRHLESKVATRGIESVAEQPEELSVEEKGGNP